MAEAEKKVAAGQGEGDPQEAEGCGPEAGREKEVGTRSTGNRGRSSQKAEERDTRAKENETGWGAMGSEGPRGK